MTLRSLNRRRGLLLLLGIGEVGCRALALWAPVAGSSFLLSTLLRSAVVVVVVVVVVRVGRTASASSLLLLRAHYDGDLVGAVDSNDCYIYRE